MNQYEANIRDLFDDDTDFEYHQDYRDTTIQLTNPSFLLPLIFCLIPVIYHIFYLLDYDLLPIPELLWNCLVYATPSRLLDALEAFKNPLRIENPSLKGIPRTHASKSETMRRVLGLDAAGGIMESVTQAGRRRLSTLPGMKLNTQGRDGRPAGLGNWDNSCYQNSVLQGLASLDSLAKYLTDPKIDIQSIDLAGKPDMKMAEALKGLIASLNDPENNGKRIWTPATLKNMSSWQQQDAQEYFSKVLDELDKEVGKVVHAMWTSRGLESNGVFPSSKSSEESRIPALRNPLEGLIAQRVGCTKCGYSEGLSMIPFNCLTVPLGRAWEQSIEECLDEYTKLELIEGVECGKCTLLKTQRLLSLLVDRTKDSEKDRQTQEASKARLKSVNEALEEDDYEDKTILSKCNIPSKSRVSTSKTRQAVVARPPKSLVFHINRSLFDESTGELRKNYSEVRFPKILDLGSWCLGSSGMTDDSAMEEWLLNPEKPLVASSRSLSRTRGPMYEIRSVVTHFGRHENGHYICYKKHPVPESEGKGPTEQWWRLSDDEVTKVSEDTVLGQGGVFMLFYDRIELAGPMFQNISEPSSIPFATAVDIATSVPLPSQTDDGFSDDESLNSVSVAKESVATSASEYDEDELDGNDSTGTHEHYQPTKAIVVPQFIQNVGRVHENGESVGDKGMGSPGSLVMV